MFIQTEATADPSKLNFLPGREVVANGRLELHDRSEAGGSPLAEHLFAIPGVAAISFDREFITITKAAGDWQHLKPAILGVIMEHFMSGAPVLSGEQASRAETSGASDPDRAELVREALRQVIDPELGYNIVDLGLVYEVGVDDDGVRIVMTTTTPGCPATHYLKRGASDRAGAVRGVRSVDVVLTHEPRWAPELMSPEAKAHFGISSKER